MSKAISQRSSAEEAMSLQVSTARMYYLDRLSKLEISTRLGVSRFKVARLLDAAHASGIVEIRIHDPILGDTEMSQRLSERYGLLNCRIVPTPRERRSDEQLRVLLGKAAAALLAQSVTETDILGIGWGRTVQEVVPNLPALPKIPVVQLSGMTGAADDNATEVVRRIASLTRGPAFPLYAPLLLPSPETVEELRQLPGIAATFGMHDRITVALLSIGSWNPPNSQLRVQFSHHDQAHLDALGVRTEMGGILLNDEGEQVVGREISGRILAIDGARLRQVRTVIGVAGGPTKRQAIKVALISHHVNSLVTDTDTATWLLEQ